MAQDDWSNELTWHIAQQVRAQRKAKGWSARDLADECRAVGFDIPRSTVADLESGRRRSVSVAELLILARALDVSPVDLVWPLGVCGQAMVSPTELASILDVRDWWRGSSTDPGVIKDAETATTEMAAIADAVSGLNELLAKQQEEFTRKLAEQQKALNALAARPSLDRGAQQIRMLQELATLHKTGVKIPADAMRLLERELPPVFCANEHKIPVGDRYCPECGAGIGRIPPPSSSLPSLAPGETSAAAHPPAEARRPGGLRRRESLPGLRRYPPARLPPRQAPGVAPQRPGGRAADGSRVLAELGPDRRDLARRRLRP